VNITVRMAGQLHGWISQVTAFFPCCRSSWGGGRIWKKIVKYAYLHILSNAIPPRAVLTKKLENKDREHCEKKIQEIDFRTSSQSLGINWSKQVVYYFANKMSPHHETTCFAETWGKNNSPDPMFLARKFWIKILIRNHYMYFSPLKRLNTSMRKGKEGSGSLHWLTDADPGGQKTHGSYGTVLLPWYWLYNTQLEHKYVK
jgi:hypothetical protein